MKKFAFITVSILTFCIFAFGQNSNCPQVSVTGPSSAVQPGETMSFTANIEGNETDLSKINYQWSVDKGTITEGQGESFVIVNTEGVVDSSITATVEIKGLASGCNKSHTQTGILSRGGDLIVFDEFEKLPKKDEKARLSALVSKLEDDIETNAFIILYHPSQNKKLYESRVLRLKNFLTKDKRIPAERIFIVLGGHESEERTRIYIVPKGAQLPTP